MNQLTNSTMNSVLLLRDGDSINQTVFDFIANDVKTKQIGVPISRINDTITFLNNNNNNEYDFDFVITGWTLDTNIKDYLFAINNNVGGIFSDDVEVGSTILDFLTNYILNNQSYLIENMDWVTQALKQRSNCNCNSGNGDKRDEIVIRMPVGAFVLIFVIILLVAIWGLYVCCQYYSCIAKVLHPNNSHVVLDEEKDIDNDDIDTVAMSTSPTR